MRSKFFQVVSVVLALSVAVSAFGQVDQKTPERVYYEGLMAAAGDYDAKDYPKVFAELSEKFLATSPVEGRLERTIQAFQDLGLDAEQVLSARDILNKSLVISENNQLSEKEKEKALMKLASGMKVPNGNAYDPCGSGPLYILLGAGAVFGASFLIKDHVTTEVVETIVIENHQPVVKQNIVEHFSQPGLKTAIQVVGALGGVASVLLILASIGCGG